MAMVVSASPVQEEAQPGSKQFRNHLAAAVRSINWSYAIFWSVSTTRPAGVLIWRDGFYNGETKTRKVTVTSSRLTADQLALQRSEQLRELYESLQPPPPPGARPRPVAAALSPEDLGDTEWFYVVCMTYAFRQGQGSLPGKSLARNEHVWLRNAHLADTKTFPRALLAKRGHSDNRLHPLMDGVLELGTTDSVLEDPDLIAIATKPFRAMPQFVEEPTSSPSSDDDDTRQVTAEHTSIAFEDIDDRTTAAMEPTMISEGHGELGNKFFTEHPPDASFEEVAMEIGELYSLCEVLEDVQAPLEDDWISMDMDGVLGLSPSPEPAAAPELATADHALVTSFQPWTRSDADDGMAALTGLTATGGEPPQKVLKKVVGGGRAWAANNGGGGDGSTRTTTTQESGVTRNHVMSERRRREKLNEMFVVLKSLIPSTRRVDKASILAETIAYLKELERRVHELESRDDDDLDEVVVGTKKKKKVVSATANKRRKTGQLDAAGDREESWVRSSPSNVVSVAVADREVVVDVQCPWKERLMARVFDAVKSLHLNVLSVQSSTLDGLMELKLRAQFASSAAVAPGMITEALQEAISCKH